MESKEEETNKTLWGTDAKLKSRFAFISQGQSKEYDGHSGLRYCPYMYAGKLEDGTVEWMWITSPYTVKQRLFIVVRDTLLAFKEIESIKGKNAVQRKEDVLRNLLSKYNATDYPEIVQDTIKKMLQAGVDKQHPTNLSKISISITHTEETLNDIARMLNHYDNDIQESPEVPFLEVNSVFLRLIDNLFDAKSATNADRLVVSSFIALFPPDLQEMMAKVFTKSLNIGLATKSINDAFGCEVIMDLELMKCKKELSIIEKWLKQGKDVYAELKYDGIRGFSTVVNSSIKSMKTYNMTPFFLDKLTTIVPQLETMAKLSKQDGFFFDFEITNNLRQSISGKVNKHLQGTSVEGCDKDWIINVFDVVDLGVFGGGDTLTYNERRSLLESIFDNCPEELRSNISLAKRWKINSMEELNKLFEEVLLDGQEGLVVKCGDGIYELKKSALWIKLKAEKEADLVIVDYYNGKQGTKREHLIGGFCCESSDGLLSVNIGSGFSDKLLKGIDSNTPQSYIGKVIEAKYNGTIQNKESDYSLFLGRFKRFRFDKDIANSLSEILEK